MKKIAYIAVVALAAAACSKEVNGGGTASITIVPETKTVYTDEALPVLSVNDVPEGTDVKWTSGDPSIVKVSDKGELAFAVKDIEDAEKIVTITAEAGGVSAKCTLTVKGQIARYEVLDFTEDFGFKMLDRNVGAKTKEEVGKYWQWGKNAAVAENDETEVNANYDAAWGPESEGFADWTVAENTPCPKGWGLPDKEQISKIKFIAGEILTYEEFYDYYEGTEAEYQKYKSIYDSLNLLNSGKFTAPEKDGKYMGESFWSSTITEVDGKSLPGIYWYGSSPIYENNNFNVAVPVRCVK